MSFVIEKDWTTKVGYRAVVIITPMGHRCGYVGVPVGNQHHGKKYDDVPVNVHGGLTYSTGKSDYPVPSDDLWWLGYDCLHVGDAPDPELRSDKYKKMYASGMLSETIFEDDVIRTLEYCIGECESLAKQLKEAT